MKIMKLLVLLFVLGLGAGAFAQTTTTTTNYAVGVAIPDNDAAGLASTMTFSTPVVSLSDLNVTLNVSGTFNGDLYCYITHSSGFSVLLNRVGKSAAKPLGNPDDGLNVTLDDSAANGDIHLYASPIVGALTGSWRPDGRTNDPSVVLDTDTPDPLSALSSFNGLNPNGSWTLFIADLEPGDTSTLVSWGLEATGFTPPSIVAQPSNTTNCLGSSASFSVTAAGTAPLIYQWFRGATTLTNQTNATLSIPSVAAGDAGNYTVVITNNYGSITSSVATLVLNVNTTASGPANQANICPGASATFTVTPAGTGPFTYVWRKNGGIIAPTTASITISPVSAGDAGTYCVEVTGTCNSVTNCATLTVAVPPTITAQPQSITGVLSNAVTFNVTGSSPNPLSYIWTYNGSILANGGQFSGATTASLTVSALSCTNEGGLLQVVVTNCAGSVTSSVATLSVRPIGAVFFDFETISQYTNNFPTTGNGGTDPLTLVAFEAAGVGVNGTRGLDATTGNTSLVDSALPAMAYDFSLNGKILRASVMVKIKAPAANDTTMELGFASKPSRLDSGDENVAFMAVKLRSTAQPALTYLIEGRHKVFAGTTVNSLNTPTAATLVAGDWYKLSLSITNIKSTTANSFSYGATLQDMGVSGLVPGTVNFTIGSTVVNADMVNDNSVYADFRFRENTGMDNIDNLSINTADGPIFFACPPGNRTVLQGRPTTFNAYPDGTPPWTYQWFKGPSLIAGATDWKYSIPAVAAGDAADYTVVVTGTSGSITSQVATLTVTPDTVGPVLVSAGSFDGCTIGACFDEPLDPVSAIAPGNYSVSGGGSIGFVQLRPDGKSVILYPSPGVSGAFSITVSGVKDVYGNTMIPNSVASGNVASYLSSTEIGGPLPSLSLVDGVYTCKDGDFDITAGGADVWGNADQFRYTYQPKTNDFDVRVKIANQTLPNTVLKGGLLARESIDPASRTLHAIVNPPWPGLDRYETGARAFYGNSTVSWGSGFANGNKVAASPNSWIRLRRVNNTYTAYAATNGVDWTVIAQTTAITPGVMLVGMEQCAHVQGRAGTSEFRSYGDFGGFPAAVIAITTQPANATVAAGATATFTVAATVTGGGAPSSELQYQWQRSDGLGGFTNVPNANAASTSFTTPAVFFNDSGAQFRCVVRVSGAPSQTSNPATLTVTDTAAPLITSVTMATSSSNTVGVVFNELVSVGTADVAGNYVITNSAGTAFAVTSAAFFGPVGTNSTLILLTTATPLPAGTYFVTVNGVKDRAGNSIAANTTVQFQQFASPLAAVVEEIYINAGSGTTTNALDTQAIYAQGQPTYIVYSNLFGFNMGLGGSIRPDDGVNALDNFGVKAYTHFIPPTNGNYKFWIRSDDVLRLRMNTNGPSGLPSVVVASSTNTSLPELAANAIDGTSGTKYLNFDKLNTGFNVTPAKGASIVTGMRFTTANDAAERDPTSFTLEGTTGDIINGPWSLIVSNATGLTNVPATATPRQFPGPIVSFDNGVSYTSYRLRFPTIRDPAAANSMQISEVEFLNDAGQDVTDSPVVTIAENTAFSGNYTVGTFAGASRTNITLVGGQRYYLEALFKEGGGGDGFSVTWTDPTTVTAPPNTSVIPSGALSYPVGTALSTPVVVELYTRPILGSTFGGSDLASLGTVTNHPKWANFPDLVGYERYFGFTPQLVDTSFNNYAGRLYSYFVPPSTGLYKFYLRSDDASQLWMNTNPNPALSTDPAGMSLIGQLTAFTGPYTLVGQNVSLNGGQAYYIEGRWKEGGGGDGFSMVFKAQADNSPVFAVPVPEVSSNNFYAFPSPPVLDVGAVSLTGITPSSPVLSEGQTVFLSPVGVSGAQPYTYTWFKNGAFVADTITYTTLPAVQSDNGAVYTLVISNGFSRASASATVTVNADLTAPTLLSVTGHEYETNVILTFSEPLKAATAVNAGNYQIPGLTVRGAFLDSTGRRVSLFTSPQTPNAPYTISVNGVADNVAVHNPILATNVSFNAWGLSGCEQGYILVEVFTNIGAVGAFAATDYRGLQIAPNFVNNIADITLVTNKFQWSFVPPLTGNALDNYGVRMTARFIPPADGVYRFYIRCDDSAVLFMNTNAVDSANPAGRVQIATDFLANANYASPNTTTPASQRVSAGIPLTGGQAYYIEALMKEGGGADFFQLAFREAADPSTPANNESAPGTFFALPPNPSGDTTAPQIVRTYSLSGNTIIVEFNELLHPGTAQDGVNYAVSGALVGSVATLRPDGKSVLVEVSGLNSSTYDVTVDGVADIRCNSTVGAFASGKVFAPGQGLRDDADIGANNTNPLLTSGTAGVGVGVTTAANPFEKGSATVDLNRLDILTGGSDIWDNADGFHFAHGFYTGDFDLRVRVESLTPRDNWSKAGLMVRESLDPGSRNHNVIVDPNTTALDGSGPGANIWEANTRPTLNAASSAWSQSNPGPVPYPNAWVRLRRIGNNFLAYASSDGVSWTQFGSTSAIYPATVYAGLATTAHNNNPGQTATAVYHDFGLIFPPSILLQPTNLMVLAGQSASFTVVVGGGTAPFFYQWRFNSTPIPNATNSTFTIASALPANAGNYDVLVSNMSATVTSDVAVLMVKEQDYGDAPDTYKTLLASGGPRHIIVPGFFLGTSVDGELDGFPSAGADGDDLNATDDENGVTFGGPLLRGQLNSVTVVASSPGRLDAWIDLNGNGVFDGGDQIFANQALVAGPNVLSFTVPTAAIVGNSYARFRLSSVGGLSPVGPANDGEVEDYAVSIANRQPVAVKDGVVAVKNVALAIPTAQLLANDSDPDLDPLTVTSVSTPSVRGGSVSLAGATITYTPPANFVGGDAFNYTISDGRGGTATAEVCVVVNATSLAFAEPIGGWTYAYGGVWTTTSDPFAGPDNGGAKSPVTLDGTWNGNNGSSEWDGRGRGPGTGATGGISSTNGILTVEDVNIGSGSLNNRKIYFEHALSQEGFTSSNHLDTGITISFRARLTPADVVPAPDLAGLPDGWGIFSGGKGHFGVHQLNGGAHQQISFSLVRASEPDNSYNFTSAGLTMNRNDSDTVGGSGTSSGTASLNQVVALDPTVFHEFWITIQPNDATPGNGTHTVKIYVDGSTTPQVFNVTAGNGNDGETGLGGQFISLGQNNSTGAGVYDTDFYAYKLGVIPPSGLTDPAAIVQQPTNITVSAGSTATFSVGVTGTPPISFQWMRGGLPIAGATGQSYSFTPQCVDNGAVFSVTVSNCIGETLLVSGNAVLTVVDTTPPVINCPTDVTVATDPGACSAALVSLGTPVVSDNCSVQSIVSNAPSLYPLGVTLVVWKATDTSGNMTTCTQKVTVVDMEAPVITCSSNLTVECVGAVDTPVFFTTTATDNCATHIVCVPASGSVFAPGTTTVHCTVDDTHGNTNTCAFTVTVVDTTPPRVCVTNAPIVTIQGSLDNFVGPEPASPSQNLQDHLAGIDLVGFDQCHNDQWFATSFGNLPELISEARLRIRIRTCGGVSFPQNDTITLGFAGLGGSLRPERWTRRLGTYPGDGVPGLLAANWVDPMVNEFVLDLGNLPNANGSKTDLVPVLLQLRSLDLFVQDDSDVDYAILEIRTCECRTPVIAAADTNTCNAVVTFASPVFNDTCDTALPPVVCVPPSGSVFPFGSTLVSCSTVDSSGNRGRCSFKVIVTDASPAPLSISHVGTNAVITWRVTCTTDALEQTSNLNPVATWTPVTAPVSTVVGHFQVVVPIESGNRFFRVRRL